VYVDLGAERLLMAAEKGDQKIAVEIKSFLSKSEIDDLEKALGQYALYRAVLAELEPDRTLLLAVTKDVLRDIFKGEMRELLQKYNLARVIGFDPQTEEITPWLT